MEQHPSIHSGVLQRRQSNHSSHHKQPRILQHSSRALGVKTLKSDALQVPKRHSPGAVHPIQTGQQHFRHEPIRVNRLRGLATGHLRDWQSRRFLQGGLQLLLHTMRVHTGLRQQVQIRGVQERVDVLDVSESGDYLDDRSHKPG